MSVESPWIGLGRDRFVGCGFDDVADRVERGFPVEPSRCDDGCGGVEANAPVGPEASGDLSKDDGMPQRPFASIGSVFRGLGESPA